MHRIAILGADDTGRRLWEALTRCGDVDVVAFVDTDTRRRRRQLLGVDVVAPEWLCGASLDAVVIGSREGADVGGALPAGAPSDCLVRLPVEGDDEQLARAAARRFPDPLRGVLAGPVPPGARVGVFGTGAGGAKVWEALTEIDGADAAWFADNDVRRQGQVFLWLDVIAPSEIGARGYDAVAIGSMSRQAIESQLRSLGVPPERILAPDVAASVERIREQLATTGTGRQLWEAAS